MRLDPTKKTDYLASRTTCLSLISLVLLALILLFSFCLVTLFNNYSGSAFKTRIFSKKEHGFIFSLLRSLDTNSELGLVSIKYHELGAVVKGVISGLKPGSQHGLIILENMNSMILREEKNSSTNYFSLNNFHLNPTKSAVHSCRNGEKTGKFGHMGDLGNIVANEAGMAEIDRFFPKLKIELLFGRPLVILRGEDLCEEDRIEEPWEGVLGMGVLAVESQNDEENAIYEELEKRMVEKKDLDIGFMERVRKEKKGEGVGRKRDGNLNLREGNSSRNTEDVDKFMNVKYLTKMDQGKIEPDRNESLGSKGSSEEELKKNDSMIKGLNVKENNDPGNGSFLRSEGNNSISSTENHSFTGNNSKNSDETLNLTNTLINDSEIKSTLKPFSLPEKQIENNAFTNDSKLEFSGLEPSISLPEKLIENNAFTNDNKLESTFSGLQPFSLPEKLIENPIIKPKDPVARAPPETTEDSIFKAPKSLLLEQFDAAPALVNSSEILENQNFISTSLDKAPLKSFDPSEKPNKPSIFRHKSRSPTRARLPDSEADFESPTIIRKAQSHLSHDANRAFNRGSLKPVSHMSANSNEFNLPPSNEEVGEPWDSKRRSNGVNGRFKNKASSV